MCVGRKPEPSLGGIIGDTLEQAVMGQAEWERVQRERERASRSPWDNLLDDMAEQLTSKERRRTVMEEE